jgi:hypothetical protein
MVQHIVAVIERIKRSRSTLYMRGVTHVTHISHYSLILIVLFYAISTSICYLFVLFNRHSDAFTLTSVVHLHCILSHIVG